MVVLIINRLLFYCPYFAEKNIWESLETTSKGSTVNLKDLKPMRNVEGFCFDENFKLRS
jgi:hypothetical protein